MAPRTPEGGNNEGAGTLGKARRGRCSADNVNGRDPGLRDGSSGSSLKLWRLSLPVSEPSYTGCISLSLYHRTDYLTRSDSLRAIRPPVGCGGIKILVCLVKRIMCGFRG